MDLSYNRIGQAGFILLGQSLRTNKTLGTLILDHNPGKMEGVMHLAVALRVNRSLSKLNLGYLDMGDEGGCHIATNITENKRLAHLDLSGNRIGMEGSGQLVLAMQQNTSLRSLDISNNPVPQQHLATIESILERNVCVNDIFNHILNDVWEKVTAKNLIEGGASDGGTRFMVFSAGIQAQNGLPKDFEDEDVASYDPKNDLLNLHSQQSSMDLMNAQQTNGIKGMRVISQEAIQRTAQYLAMTFGPFELPFLLPGQLRRAQQQRRPRKLRVGYADTIGRRLTMEDMIVIKRNFRGKDDEDLLAVFDGHGGRDASEFCAEHLPPILAAHLDAGQPPNVALREAFLETNQQMSHYDINDGTTGAVCLLTDNKIYCANAGDTRIVLSRKGRAVRLTYDHKADAPDEMARIQALGGHVVEKRVMGILAVARSLGDFFLHPYVTADPFLTVTNLSPGDEFIILACDGVWDVLSDELACHIVATDNDPVQASLKLIDQAFLTGSTDNISVIVAYL